MRIQRSVWFSNFWDLQVQLPSISSCNICVCIFLRATYLFFPWIFYNSFISHFIVTGSFIWQKSCLPFNSCQSIYSEVEASSSWDPSNIEDTPHNCLDTSYTRKRGFFICTFLCIRAHWQCRFWFRVFTFMLHWKRMSQYENYPILQMLKNWFY